MQIYVGMNKRTLKQIIHTYRNIYIYIYIERERERYIDIDI